MTGLVQFRLDIYVVWESDCSNQSCLAPVFILEWSDIGIFFTLSLSYVTFKFMSSRKPDSINGKIHFLKASPT